MASPPQPTRRVGVDTGGTFTDLVESDGESLRVVKVPSTPRRPERAVVAALEQANGRDPSVPVVHGTTVALNALLERKLAKTALVTGAGFRDLVEIGRQERPEIYALHPVKPEPLVPRRLRFEVSQRSWPDPRTGELVTVESPTGAELDELRARIGRSGAKSVAVCLLHSYADPRIERAVADALAPLGLPVTCSAELLPEHREVERFSTALCNAALVPLVADYLERLDEGLGGAQLSVLQSNGGTLASSAAAREPARIVLSGPAGGVVGAARAAREAGLDELVTLDMGGTSTDVAFHTHRRPAADDPRAARHVASPNVGGLPLALPTLDIHTIGCGGGSLVGVDAGGVLQVGPESAGADPGPVAYGKSDRLTVTDAHVFLGHVRPGHFLGGEFALDVDAVARGFEELAGRLGVRPVEAARAVLASARAAMRRALAVMTLQRGKDPRTTPLVAFGGAGGLHAAALAETLDLPAALVPAEPGALSARGMATATARRDGARTVLGPLGEWDRTRRKRELAALGEALTEELRAEGHSARSISVGYALDLRYRGQSFELSLPDGRDPAEAFHRAHERLNGYRFDERAVELVCLRASARVREDERVPDRPRRRAMPARAVATRVRADFGRALRVPVVDRRELVPGHRFEGPAIVEEYSGTTLVPPGVEAEVTAGGHLLLVR